MDTSGDVLDEQPVVGPALFENTPTDYLALALVPLVAYLLFRTNLGLEITAVGEDPEAADTMGVPVFAVRYFCVVAGGALAGAAGAHLSLAFSKLWVTGMTAGRGWIAIALVIFAQWRPWRALVGAYLFGGITIIQLHSQALGLEVEPQLLAMLPYLATIMVLVLISHDKTRARLNAPANLGQTFFAST
jgi:simple sugar transport system permease protein